MIVKIFFLLFGLDSLVSLFWLRNIKVLPKPLIIKLGKEEEAKSENKHQIVIQRARLLDLAQFVTLCRSIK